MAKPGTAHRRLVALTTTSVVSFSFTLLAGSLALMSGVLPIRGLAFSERIDIGIGTALPGRGLVVPVIRDAGRLDLAGIAAALGELVARARDDALTPADLQGGTFTISNHGVSGSLVAAPIVINQPQSAILGIGKLEKRAIVAAEGGEDRVVVRPCCYVTLTIDHRVMDGHRANRFLTVLRQALEGGTY